jgi:uncharacterized protein (TIGR02996 family)
VDRTGAWLRDRINEHAPGPGQDQVIAATLADVTATIWSGGGMLFGMVVPAQLASRDELLDIATEVLNRWLPLIDRDDVLERITAMARKTSLPVDTKPYAEKVQAVKAAAQAAAKAKAKAKSDDAKKLSETTEPRNVELESAIDDNPTDLAAYEILADWLEAHGSPRGALIHMQLRGDPVDAYIAEHRDALLGDIAKRFDQDFKWNNGYISSAKFSSDGDVDAEIEKLLQHPSGRRLYELRVGMMGDDAMDFSSTSIIALLAAEEPRALRALFLGDFEYPQETELSWYEVGDISGVWKALPELETLTIRGIGFELGRIEHDNLEDLEIQTTSMSGSQMRALVEAKLPALERLVLWLGQDGDLDEINLRALLMRNDLPELRELGIMNTTLSDAVCGDLLGSPLLAKLERLDLSMGTLGDEGAQLILTNAAKFRHLKELNVSQSYLSLDAIRQLAALGPKLIEDNMNDASGPDDRYIAISE